MNKIVEPWKFEIKDIDQKKGLVTVYANAFNNIDSDNDISLPGSFTKTMKESFKRVKWFLNHNKEQLLGVPIEAIEDSFGLKITGQLNMSKEIGRDTLEDYVLYAENGRTLEHSIGVQAIKYEVLEGDAIPQEYRSQGIDWIRKVSEWKWWEYSTLTSWGANENTPMVDIKSLTKLQDTIDFFEKMLKGKYTDERLKKIEETYNILKSLKSEPLKTTQQEPDRFTLSEPMIEVMKKSKLFN